MRIIARANAWRKVKGAMGERRISRKRQGNVLSSCVSPAYLNALYMLVLTGECSGLRKRVMVCICALVYICALENTSTCYL